MHGARGMDSPSFVMQLVPALGPLPDNLHRAVAVLSSSKAVVVAPATCYALIAVVAILRPLVGLGTTLYACAAYRKRGALVKALGGRRHRRSALFGVYDSGLYACRA